MVSHARLTDADSSAVDRLLILRSQVAEALVPALEPVLPNGFKVSVQAR
jgi:hypothetical protein